MLVILFLLSGLTGPQAGQGESPRDPALDASELAAYSAVAGLILNLDEVVTKE